ncbi:MAG: hypothetical protein NVSMB60_10320 [Mycobacterium sp.]
MTSGTHHEKVINALIAVDLGGNSAVRAAEHHGGGFLRLDEADTVFDALTGMFGPASDEAVVAVLECFPSGRRIGTG